jgi:hypothetical protein
MCGFAFFAGAEVGEGIFHVGRGKGKNGEERKEIMKNKKRGQRRNQEIFPLREDETLKRAWHIHCSFPARRFYSRVSAQKNKVPRMNQSRKRQTPCKSGTQSHWPKSEIQTGSQGCRANTAPP